MRTMRSSRARYSARDSTHTLRSQQDDRIGGCNWRPPILAGRSNDGWQRLQVEQRRTPGLLDSAKAAQRLDCTERMVCRLRPERRIPFVRVGRLARYRPTNVEQYISPNLDDSVL